MRNKVIDVREAAEIVPEGATMGVLGGGGGLVEPDALLAAIEERFLATGGPVGLRVVHALGLGDRDRRGLNRLAYEGLVRKVIGGHWIWSPRMQALAREEKIEAYVLPSGVTSQLMREIGAGRPGLITHVGLGHFRRPASGRREDEQIGPGQTGGADRDRGADIVALSAFSRGYRGA